MLNSKGGSRELQSFLLALDFLRERDEFKTVELHRHLRCGYSDVCRVIDGLILLKVIEVAGENPRKYRRIDSEERRCYGNIPVVIGYDERGNLLTDNLSRAPHILVGGMSGYGKSVFLKNIIFDLALGFSSDEMRLLLFDLKMVEFDEANPFGEVVRSIDGAIEVLKKLAQIMNERRADMDRLGIVGSLSRNGTGGLEEYNARSDKKLPKIVVVIDEYAELVMQSDEAAELVYKLALGGHGTGIHMILASQRASEEIFSPELRAAIPTRASFRLENEEDSHLILGSVGAEKLHDSGEMLYSSIWYGSVPIKVKVPYNKGKDSTE